MSLSRRLAAAGRAVVGICRTSATASTSTVFLIDCSRLPVGSDTRTRCSSNVSFGRSSAPNRQSWLDRRKNVEQLRNQYGQNQQQQQNSNARGKSWRRTEGTPLLALPMGMWLYSLKKLMGFEELKLDEDPIKDLIKKSYLARRQRGGGGEAALSLLQQALSEAERRVSEGEDAMLVTRVLDELANAHLELGDAEQANTYFLAVYARLRQLHRRDETSPDVVGVLLKLADVYFNLDRINDAELTYRHILQVQHAVVEEHFTHYKGSHGAWEPTRSPITVYGSQYAAPVALYGMINEAYAHFLLKGTEQDRAAESKTYFDRACGMSAEIYGSFSPATVVMLNNYAIACIAAEKFDQAEVYQREVVRRAVVVESLTDRLSGFYCNYAECLFHIGQLDEALNYGRRAVELANESANPELLNYARQFFSDLQADYSVGKGVQEQQRRQQKQAEHKTSA